MRRFTLGSAPERQIVVIEVDGSRMSVVQMTPDGGTKRTEKQLGSPAEAQGASERMARELIARGFVEKLESGRKPAPSRPTATKSAAAPARAREEVDASHLFDEVEPPVAAAAPVLARLATAAAATPATETAPKKKTKTGGKKKKRRKAGSGDALDKRVLAGIAAVGVLVIGFFGYMAYDAFFKPPTIVGVWRGSTFVHEVSRRLSHTRYDLILDDQKRAAMTLQEKYTSVGTYSLRGNRLQLTLKDEDGEATEHQYKIVLGRSTLDLLDPQSGELVVQLIRQSREQPVIGGKAPATEAPKDLALGDPGKVDTAADERLASVQFSPRDGAFRLRHHQGWEVATSSRPDNTYCSAIFTHDSAKIAIYADVAGSLMTGSPANQFEEGSELAPVHRAHELYKKTAAEEYSDYNESKPALFKGSSLGEGRISEFTASGGLFSSNLRGYHVTLLTNDRRVSILCHCPESEFAKLKPTFLAVCRSLAR